jgi:hypothetical protein
MGVGANNIRPYAYQPGECAAPLPVHSWVVLYAALWFGLVLLVFVTHDVTPLSIKNSAIGIFHTKL